MILISENIGGKRMMLGLNDRNIFFARKKKARVVIITMKERRKKETNITRKTDRTSKVVGGFIYIYCQTIEG